MRAHRFRRALQRASDHIASFESWAGAVSARSIWPSAMTTSTGSASRSSCCAPVIESEEIVRRFRNERQILASIDHPFIAKLLDGGSTPEGFPYLVIEYVEGQPIDQYCDARRLPIDERLELFCKVCTAVHFAHQNLVVHRDLKPGNILVTPDGVPKLLDFGIAKLLNPEMFSLTAGETRADARMMTPEYASPEQVRGEPITTASDVYSLGVLLYELVTGHLPYRLQGRQLHQLARAICDDAPVRPSTVVDVEEEITGIRGDVQRITAETVSRTREGTPERLRRKLRGDIEHILLMAMRKEPHLRYASAEQFSDDIRRHHEGLPVRARKGTWTYRSSRFVRRHRVGLGIVALSMASLVTISAVTIRERRRAEQESARAKAVIQFLTSTLAAIDPRLAQGNEPTVRQMLDEAEARLSTAHGLLSPEEAAVREVIAESRLQLGHLQQARDLFAKALTSSVAAFGERDAETLAARVGLAAAEAELGELIEAEKNARLAAEGAAAVEGEEPRIFVRALNTLAGVLLRLGMKDRLTEAEQILARAASRADASLPAGDPDRLATARLRAELMIVHGRPAEAEPLARETYRTAVTALGPRHPATLEAFDTLSNCLLALSRYSELLKVQQDLADDTRRVLGEDHIMSLRARETIAETLRQLDRFDQAKKAYEDVLIDKRRVLGERHRSTLLTRHNVALLQKDLGQPQKAEEMLRDVANIQRTVLGDQHPDTLDSEMMIALTLYEQRRMEASRDAYAEVLPRIKAALGENADAYLVGTVNYAGLLYRLGDLEVAERTFRDALAAHRRAFGDRYFGTYYTMMELGTTLVRLKRYAEAEELFLAALAGFREIYQEQPNHHRVRDALGRLTDLYERWGHPAKAIEYRTLLDKATAASRSSAQP